MAMAFGPIDDGHTPPFQTVADTVHRYRLPNRRFRALLSAFRQDLSKTRYAIFQEVTDQGRRSANPVRELLLQLTGGRDSGIYLECRRHPPAKLRAQDDAFIPPRLGCRDRSWFVWKAFKQAIGLL
jgi:phytoene/squalene synthetase